MGNVVDSAIRASGFLRASSFVIPAAGSGTLFPCDQNSDLGRQFGSYGHHCGPLPFLAASISANCSSSP